MDHATRIFIGIGVLGGAWWLLSRDKTPAQRKMDGVVAGESPGWQGPPSPEMLSEQAANTADEQLKGDWAIDEEGPHGPSYYNSSAAGAANP